MNDLSCRIAGAPDLAAILPMMLDFNRGEGIATSREVLEPALRKLIADPGLGLVPLFVLGESTIGYGVLTWGFDLEFGGRDSYLTELYVRPEARGRGLGRSAMDHVLRLARAHGAGALHLGVRADNVAAARLYEALGFADWTRRVMTRLL